MEYSETGQFASGVLRYLAQDTEAMSFAKYPPNLAGFKDLLSNKKVQANRSVLVEVLQQQYKGLKTSAAVTQNIEALAQENTLLERVRFILKNQKKVPSALKRLVFRRVSPRYFLTAGSAAGAAATTLPALPFKKPFTQVVFSVSAKCTLNEAIATAAMNTGIPTEGLTTVHIFA